MKMRAAVHMVRWSVAGIALACLFVTPDMARSEGEVSPASTGSPTPTNLAVPARRESAEKRVVDTGSEEGAKEYYREVSRALVFLDGNKIQTSSLQDLLHYAGYGALLAEDLERLPSADLMDFSSLKSKVSNLKEFEKGFKTQIQKSELLVSRFFAPKITDDRIRPPEKLGWRKLVWLRPRNGSEASKQKLGAIVILFNYFKEPGTDPFQGNRSVNTQVALIPERANRRSLYWLDYNEIGKISYFLPATFDARDLPGEGTTRYHVPNACNHCHGGPAAPMLNYLDTDHWFDRVEPGQDFEVVRGKFPVLFDGGLDEASDQFKSAFETIKKINHEIVGQNRRANPQSIQMEAGDNWLLRHESKITHIAPIDRPVRPSWNRADTNDEKLLPLLNKYCFRCHGSVSFNVFDKSAVTLRASTMRAFIETKVKGQKMPPDREIPDDDKRVMVELLKKLKF